MNQPRPSLFKIKDSKDGFVDIHLSSEELLALMDIVQFSYRMYKIASDSLKDSGQEDKAKQMDTKASIAVELNEILLINADPGYPKSDTEIC